MKRYGKTEHLWDRICSEQNIDAAMRDALIKHKYRGMGEPELNKAQKYMIEHWDECKEIVRRTLTSENYHFAPLHSFEVYEPKHRVIHCPQLIPDKIITICAYRVLRDYFYKKFVRNTYNCIKGRGIHDAKRAIEHIMRTHPDWFYCQTDIRQFYPTLRHDIIKDELAKVFKDTKVLRLLYTLLDAFCDGRDEQGREIGIAIGINLSQLMAILMMNPILRQINEMWHYPCVNFTDDLFVAIPRKQQCHQFMQWYISQCAARGMQVKPNYRIAPMREPVRLIGYQFCLDASDRQYTLLSKAIKQRMQRRAKQVQHLPDKEYKQQMASYFGWCKHASCRHLMQTIFKDRYKLFMKSYKEIKESRIGEFMLPKTARVSVLDLLDKPIIFDGAKRITVNEIDQKTGEQTQREKVAVKFRETEDGEPHYFISGSQSLKDRVIDAITDMPFVGTIVEKQTNHRNKYYKIE